MKIKRLWNFLGEHPVGSKISAALIIFIAAAIWKESRDLAFASLKSLESAAATSFYLPVWIIVVLGSGWVIVIFLIWKRPKIQEIVASASQSKPSVASAYSSEIMDGMRWRWEFDALRNQVHSFKPFCPKDDTELVAMQSVASTTYTCETCQQKFGPFSGDGHYSNSKAKRQVERNLRAKGWSI